MYVLFSDNAQGYLYYGPESSAYVAPSKAIAIGVYYDKYGFSTKAETSLDLIISPLEFFLVQIISTALISFPLFLYV